MAMGKCAMAISDGSGASRTSVCCVRITALVRIRPPKQLVDEDERARCDHGGADILEDALLGHIARIRRQDDQGDTAVHQHEKERNDAGEDAIRQALLHRCLLCVLPGSAACGSQPPTFWRDDRALPLVQSW